MNPPQPIPAFLPEHRPYDVDPMAFINTYHVVDAFALLCVAIFLYFVIAIVTTGKRRLIALSVAGVPLSIMATIVVAMAFFPHSSVAQSITPPEDIAHVDYVATAPLTPGAQCPYLPEAQHVGVDTTWKYDGCVIYNDNGDIVETITIRVLPTNVGEDLVQELIPDEVIDEVNTHSDKRSILVTPILDNNGHARSVYIDRNHMLAFPYRREQSVLSVHIDNHNGDADTMEKHLSAVRNYMSLP